MTNEDRASNGEKYLALADETAGNGESYDDVIDMLSDILHTTEGRMRVEDAARIARDHYETETSNESE